VMPISRQMFTKLLLMMVRVTGSIAMVRPPRDGTARAARRAAR
jgi:hypothetical protein